MQDDNSANRSAAPVEALIAAGRKLQNCEFSEVITITNQSDKNKLMNDTLFKASFFGGRKI
ncbi:hypothetical protein FACS1894137_00370 [Spirochaetia bacterium]|nr:hypothetical protein FACS1894137_00370 [Spirochaetia bacterium]